MMMKLRCSKSEHSHIQTVMRSLGNCLIYILSLCHITPVLPLKDYSFVRFGINSKDKKLTFTVSWWCAISKELLGNAYYILSPSSYVYNTYHIYFTSHVCILKVCGQNLYPILTSTQKFIHHNRSLLPNVEVLLSDMV